MNLLQFTSVYVWINNILGFPVNMAELSWYAEMDVVKRGEGMSEGKDRSVDILLCVDFSRGPKSTGAWPMTCRYVFLAQWRVSICEYSKL